MKSYPFSSIIILNYYGEKVIERVLDSLLNLNYPKNKYEIIVVDNNSKDRSREILRNYTDTYKQVKTMLLDKNLGFSKGNNLGMKNAKGEFVALINNDCIADRNWLKKLVATATSEKEIFATCPKVLLYPKFISTKCYFSAKLVPVYAWLSKSELYKDQSQLGYLALWRKPSDSTFKYEYCDVEIPYDPYKDQMIEFTILFSFKGYKVKNTEDLHNLINFTDKFIKIINVVQKENDIEYQLSISIDEISLKKESRDKIQNAGIISFQDGYGRDIGSIVRYSQQYYEFDDKQYNKRREVYGACGAAVLYNKKLIRKMGYLDENFFMYYEDLDISERARLLGYKIVYEPQAVVRHFHAMSAKEYSPFFIYHVEKGRLLHIFYNFPLRIFIWEYLLLFLRSFATFLLILFKLRTFFYNFKTRKVNNEEPKFVRRIQIVKALSYFILHLPCLIFRRFQYMKRLNKKAIEENYLKILKGEWYFS